MKVQHLLILAVMMVMTISAKAISYEDAKEDALFLTDKMAYELSLTDEPYEKYLTIEYFYRPVKWEADAWVFLVYSHYARDLFYFTHPKVYVTYFGGNCFKNARFYTDRIHNKPASPDHHHALAAEDPLAVALADADRLGMRGYCVPYIDLINNNKYERNLHQRR